jgi:hypothetical protein
MSLTRVMSRKKTITVVALGPVLAFSLVACGGSSSTGSAATPSGNATGAPAGGGGGGGGGFGGADFAKIQSCLTAAGIAVPTGTAFPRPSGTGPRPSFSGPRPTGSGGGGRGGAGGFGATLNNPAAQAALKACGITIPTGAPTT